MSASTAFQLVGALFVLAYLVYTLVRPERF
jgi:F subunit of K+-transporting ATPase (Potass_KdpF)